MTVVTVIAIICITILGISGIIAYLLLKLATMQIEQETSKERKDDNAK